MLRKTTFGEFKSLKNAIFSISGTLNFDLCKFQPSENAKNQNSEPKDVLKWQSLIL